MGLTSLATLTGRAICATALSSSGRERRAAPALLVLGLGLANVVFGVAPDVLSLLSLPSLTSLSADMADFTAASFPAPTPFIPPISEGREVFDASGWLFVRTLGANTAADTVGLLPVAVVIGAAAAVGGYTGAFPASEVEDGMVEARGARKGCLKLTPTREMDGLGPALVSTPLGCTLALGTRFTPSTRVSADDVPGTEAGVAIDSRPRTPIARDARPTAPAPPTALRAPTAGAIDVRGPRMVEIRGFAPAAMGFAAIEGRGRRFIASEPTPVAGLLGLPGIVDFLGDLGVPPRRSLGDVPFRVAVDLPLPVEEMLDMDVVRTCTTGFRTALIPKRFFFPGLCGEDGPSKITLDMSEGKGGYSMKTEGLPVGNCRFALAAFAMEKRLRCENTLAAWMLASSF